MSLEKASLMVESALVNAQVAVEETLTPQRKQQFKAAGTLLGDLVKGTVKVSIAAGLVAWNKGKEVRDNLNNNPDFKPVENAKGWATYLSHQAKELLQKVEAKKDTTLALPENDPEVEEIMKELKAQLTD